MFRSNWNWDSPITAEAKRPGGVTRSRARSASVPPGLESQVYNVPVFVNAAQEGIDVARFGMKCPCDPYTPFQFPLVVLSDASSAADVVPPAGWLLVSVKVAGVEIPATLAVTA